MTLKAFLFDLDGTLIDSERFHYACWEETLAEYGVSINYEDWIRHYAGIPLPANARTLTEKYHIALPLDEFIARREALTYERLKTSNIGLMPYAQEFLNFLVSKKLRIALVTSSPGADVGLILEKNGLRKYFEVIITRSDVTHSKPDPESYTVCREKMGLLQAECIAFEDTLNGTKSAKAAGIMCFAIQENKEEHAKLAVADKVFPNFNEAKAFLIARQLV